jgi:hypothetical protein
MPPVIRGRLNLDSEDDAFDGVFSDPGQRSRLSQMQVEALRRAATRQPRNLSQMQVEALRRAATRQPRTRRFELYQILTRQTCNLTIFLIQVLMM